MYQQIVTGVGKTDRDHRAGHASSPFLAVQRRGRYAPSAVDQRHRPKLMARTRPLVVALVAVGEVAKPRYPSASSRTVVPACSFAQPISTENTGPGASQHPSQLPPACISLCGKHQVPSARGPPALQVKTSVPQPQRGRAGRSRCPAAGPPQNSRSSPTGRCPRYRRSSFTIKTSPHGEHHRS